MRDNTAVISYAVPVPSDLSTIVAIHDGSRWLRGVISESIRVKDGVMHFQMHWSNGKIRTASLATDIIGGYQCDA